MAIKDNGEYIDLGEVNTLFRAMKDCIPIGVFAGHPDKYMELMREYYNLKHRKNGVTILDYSSIEEERAMTALQNQLERKGLFLPPAIRMDLGPLEEFINGYIPETTLEASVGE